MTKVDKNDVAHLDVGMEVTARFEGCETYTVTGKTWLRSYLNSLMLGWEVLRYGDGSPNSRLVEVVSPKPPVKVDHLRPGMRVRADYGDGDVVDGELVADGNALRIVGADGIQWYVRNSDGTPGVCLRSVEVLSDPEPAAPDPEQPAKVDCFDDITDDELEQIVADPNKVPVALLMSIATRRAERTLKTRRGE